MSAWSGWAIVVLIAAAVFPGHDSSAQTAAEPRLALVIGNAAYKNSPLANPVSDARLMEAALKDSGFQVIKAENATIREMRRLVREFGDRLKASGGVGLFYFAGHGVQVYGENFLVSVDSDIRNEDEVADDSINAQLVLEKMQSAGNRMNLVVLDACRNNPFAVRSRSAMNGLATMNAPSGSLVAYATAPGKVASDGAGANGLYTQHLARAMRQPGMQVEEVFKQVRAAVLRDSANQQTPWENTALVGQFYFKAPQPVAVAPAPIPASPVAAPSKPGPAEQPSIELALWESVKTSTAAPDLQIYIDRYPRGAFVDLAKARIAALSPGPAIATMPTDVGLPAPKIGNVWKYRTIDLWNNRETSTFESELVRIQPERLVLRVKSSQAQNLRTVNSGRDWSTCRRMQNSDVEVCAGVTEFPLRVGKKFRFAKLPWGDGKGYVSEECEAKGLEQVTVPAGTFDTIRVECEGFWTRVFDGSGSGRVAEKSWYAPKVNRSVKWTYVDHNSNGTLDHQTQTELVEFVPN